MSKFYRTKEFQQLQKEWAQKLKSSGFKDIEFDEDNLKQSSDYFKNQYSVQEFEAKKEYFEMAEQFYKEFDFRRVVKTKEQMSFYKRVWYRHYQGMTAAKIAVNLDVTYARVQACLNKLKRSMFKLYKVTE